ncbi:MAG: hypothetical protein ACLUGQ_06140 [Coprococcus sp.]
MERQIEESREADYVRDRSLFIAMYHGSSFPSPKLPYLPEAVRSGMAQITHLVDEISANLSQSRLMDLPFESILKNMSAIGIHSSFLYTFKQPINHPHDTVFRKPDSLLLRAYTVQIPGPSVYRRTEQLVTIAEAWQRDATTAKMQQDKRRTYILAPLFSQEQLLGLIV